MIGIAGPTWFLCACAYAPTTGSADYYWRWEGNAWTSSRAQWVDNHARQKAFLNPMCTRKKWWLRSVCGVEYWRCWTKTRHWRPSCTAQLRKLKRLLYNKHGKPEGISSVTTVDHKLQGQRRKNCQRTFGLFFPTHNTFQTSLVRTTTFSLTLDAFRTVNA